MKNQQKIKQTSNWPAFKEAIKVKETNKKCSRVEALHSLYSVKDEAQDLQVNMSSSILKILYL